jgi:hypothetical protein
MNVVFLLPAVTLRHTNAPGMAAISALQLSTLAVVR